MQTEQEITENKELEFSGKVLLIDDEEGIREILEDIMDDLGFSVESAGDGMEGYERLKKGHYDLVISDMKMPRMSGIELLNKITFENLDVDRFLFITGGINIDMDNEELQKRINGYLYKPFKMQDIIDTLKEIYTK